jgi:hypothetical protein
MRGKSWRVGVLVALFAFVVLAGVQAQGGKATDEGKAEEFKGKTFDLQAKGRAAIILAFSAGKRAVVTVKSKEKTDVNLFVLDADKKVVAKDDSPGPDCRVTFTPKEDCKLRLVVINLGPGENSSTLKVSFGKGKSESKE